MYDKITYPEWLVFAKSNRAGFRHLACNIAAHFELLEAKEEILQLAHDVHPDVRVAALNAIGLYYRKELSQEEVQTRLQSLLEDPTPEVAITAAWALFLAQIPTHEVFAKFLNDSSSEYRRFAAAAVSALGTRAGDFAFEMLQLSQDPYVQANLAIGLLGQRTQVQFAADTLYTFLQKEKRMWMWDTRPNPLFQVLSPSQIRHVDHIPNYPEAIDEMTRLHLLSLLAVVEDPRSLDAVKHFLKKKTWGITGAAAAMLLQEGDETALEVVRELLHEGDGDVRLQACFVLAMLGKDETVLHDLQGAYATADHDRKLHILEAMGHVGSVESFHFLVSALKEPFPILRIAAAASLIQSIHR
jgi:HEAT repeat protein